MEQLTKYILFHHQILSAREFSQLQFMKFQLSFLYSEVEWQQPSQSDLFSPYIDTWLTLKLITDFYSLSVAADFLTVVENQCLVSSLIMCLLFPWWGNKAFWVLLKSHRKSSADWPRADIQKQKSGMFVLLSQPLSDQENTALFKPIAYQESLYFCPCIQAWSLVYMMTKPGCDWYVSSLLCCACFNQDNPWPLLFYATLITDNYTWGNFEWSKHAFVSQGVHICSASRWSLEYATNANAPQQRRTVATKIL